MGHILLTLIPTRRITSLAHRWQQRALELRAEATGSDSRIEDLLTVQAEILEQCAEEAVNLRKVKR